MTTRKSHKAAQAALVLLGLALGRPAQAAYRTPEGSGVPAIAGATAPEASGQAALPTPRTKDGAAAAPGREPAQPAPPAVFIDVHRDGTQAAPVVLTPGVSTVRTLRPWQRNTVLGTALAAGGLVVIGAALGGAALASAGDFHRAQDSGMSRDRQQELAQHTRTLAFSADVMFGSGALLGMAALILRFGTGQSQNSEAPASGLLPTPMGAAPELQ